MPGVRVVCDSTSELAHEFKAAHGVRVVPLKVLFGDESLVDGVEIDAAGFYERLRRESRNPTTSQPTPVEFEDAFREVAAEGSSVVCTCMSSEMSGTWQSAMAAQQALAGEIDVHVIDTRTVSMGHHDIVVAAVALAEAGAPASDIVAHINRIIGRQRSVFTVATLEYLRRGGRIGGARALLGSVLDIKPVLQVVDGRIDQYRRVRTSARAAEAIAQEVIGAVAESGRQAVCTVGHADRPEDARRLAALVAPHCRATPEVITIGPIVGAHAGPGTLGLSFHIP